MTHRWARVSHTLGVASRRSRIAVAVVLVLTTLLVGVGAAFAVSHDPTPTYTGCLTLSGGTITSVAEGDAPLKPCKPGQVLIRLSSGDITAVTAGTGLTGGGVEGDVSLAVAESYQLPQTCSVGQLPSWDGTRWTCVDDSNSTYTAGTGLDLNGSEFSVEPSYRLPQGCSTDQIAKWNGSAWTCQTDATLSQLATLVNRTAHDVKMGIPDNGSDVLVTSVTASSAGAYMVIAKGVVESERNISGFVSVGCKAAGDQVNFGGTVLDDDGGAEIPFALIGTVSVAAGASIPLHCWADSGADGISVVDAAIVAVRVMN